LERLAQAPREAVSQALGELAAWVRDVLVWRTTRKEEVLIHRARRPAEWDHQSYLRAIGDNRYEKPALFIGPLLEAFFWSLKDDGGWLTALP